MTGAREDATARDLGRSAVRREFPAWGIIQTMPELIPVDRPELGTLKISSKLRGQLVYFATPAGTAGVPKLGAGEYWIDAAEAARILDDGVIELVSPLDTAHMTEVELSEEQETLLNWLKDRGVQHVRVVD